MSDLITALTASARAAPESGIVRVFNHGRLRDGLIALWAGEGDTPTPELIRAGAVAALADGQTFYTYQRGIPPLREAIRRHGLIARKSLGQNFLLDLNLTARIARAAGPLDGVTVIEVTRLARIETM